ncbi:hypothetical protein BJV77DRAFT_995408, partial [Russula vinacea]
SCHNWRETACSHPGCCLTGAAATCTFALTTSACCVASKAGIMVSTRACGTRCGRSRKYDVRLSAHVAKQL